MHLPHIRFQKTSTETTQRATTLAIPAKSDILRDFHKWSRKGDAHFQAVRAVSRWLRCGYDLAELPLLVAGLTPAVIAAGISDAAQVMS